MNIEIQNKQSKILFHDSYKDIIEKCVYGSLEQLKLDEQNFEINVFIVDNEYIKSLNNQYRNIDKDTDVLSFPIFEFVEGKLNEEIFIVEDNIPLGDIVISLEKAIEQANEYNHPIERELAFLTVHSMLHLLGYDHEEEQQKYTMRKTEEEILTKLGYVR
ncbi:rRNA maturation RNase YbeY [Caldicellulosiruptoraceae bacterium PP1]